MGRKKHHTCTATKKVKRTKPPGSGRKRKITADSDTLREESDSNDGNIGLGAQQNTSSVGLHDDDVHMAQNDAAGGVAAPAAASSGASIEAEDNEQEPNPFMEKLSFYNKAYENATGHAVGTFRCASGPTYCLTDLSMMNKMLEVECDCGSAGRKLVKVDAAELNSHKGLAENIKCICTGCGYVLKTSYSSPRLGAGSSRDCFDINKRIVLALRMTGCGYADLKTITAILNISCISEHVYIDISKTIEKEMSEILEAHLDVVAQAVRIAHDKAPEPDPKDPVQIGCSFDGAWQKRGHTSHNAAGFAIELLTGLVVDFETVSNYCHKCALAGDKTKDPEWMKNHEAECQKNYDGNSGNMETAIGTCLWGRSMEKHNLQYTKILGDGDAKTFADISSAMPYGPDVPIKKLDCVNQVAKRLGKGLKKFSEQNTWRGKTKFVSDIVPRLQGYYHDAIAHNDTIVDMKTAIWASVFHMTSTDEKPHHQSCPKGEKSSCWWQRFMAKGKDPLAEDSHSNDKHCTIPMDLAEKFIVVYRRLSTPELLERCITHQTQNTNENIHSCLWQKLPKEIFVSLTTLRLAATLTVFEYNSGKLGLANALPHLGFGLGETTLTSLAKQDEMKSQKSAKKASPATKKKRISLKYSQKAAAKRNTKKAGKGYEAGGFE